MKLPRGVSGDRVVRMLEHLGYSEISQKGSHVKLRHQGLPLTLLPSLCTIRLEPVRFTESSLRCPDAFNDPSGTR
jgi:predicted RNA binding protein YcfA (HicA-like mRNA interferase family)